MELRGRPHWRVAGAVAVLMLAGCVADPGSPAAGPTSADTTESPAGTQPPSGSAPSLEPDFPTPTPEGTGPERPRPTRDNVVAVNIPGPPLGTDSGEFDEDVLSQCIGVRFSEGFGEDARVESISVRHKDAFVRDDAACDGDASPGCDGFIFRADRGDQCSVGVTWSPVTGESHGLLALTLSATCRSRAVRFCDVHGVPPSGTLVRFTSALELTADISVWPSDEPPADDLDDDVPADDPPDGESHDEDGSSPIETESPEPGE